MPPVVQWADRLQLQVPSKSTLAFKRRAFLPWHLPDNGWSKWDSNGFLFAVLTKDFLVVLTMTFSEIHDSLCSSWLSSFSSSVVSDVYCGLKPSRFLLLSLFLGFHSYHSQGMSCLSNNVLTSNSKGSNTWKKSSLSTSTSTATVRLKHSKLQLSILFQSLVQHAWTYYFFAES